MRHKRMTMTYDEKLALCGARVTLDGKPAKVSGAREFSGTVATLPDGPGCAFAWPTIARVVAAGGAFKS